MKVPEGCAICGATWGNYWTEVEGQRMFFCCEICAVEFQNMITEIKRRTGWKKVDEIEIEGDQRHRNCTAISNDHPYRFTIEFNSQGGIRLFQEKPAQS